MPAKPCKDKYNIIQLYRIINKREELMKIVFTDSKIIKQVHMDTNDFKKLGEVTSYDFTPLEDINKRIKDANAIITNKTPLNKETLKDAKNLKYIGVIATGYDNVDINYCKENGITVTNAGEYSTDAVCQHTFAFILECVCRIRDYTKFVKDGRWKDRNEFTPFVFDTYELQNMTLGIIGYGHIGKAVAKVANAFNMNVLVNTRTISNDNSVTFTDLDTLLKESDIVTVHCPLNTNTNKLFNKNTFVKMKDGAIFINNARGGIVDENDLVDALNSHKLSYACLDVLNEEPMSINSKLCEVDNLLITPHAAWAPLETRKRLMDITYNNLKNFIDGNPTNVVSK